MGARVLYLVAGLTVAACLAVLIGCAGGGTFNSGQRAPWRGQAEEACLATGAVRASDYVQPKETIDGPGVCGLERPLRVSNLSGGRVRVEPAATIGCPVTAGLDRWLKNSVQPAAYRYFGRPVVAIEQIASYGCRGRNGNSFGAPSEHAFGNALDIAGFRLAGGDKITVVRGWWQGGPRERAFLQTVFAGACAEFYTVLGWSRPRTSCRRWTSCSPTPGPVIICASLRRGEACRWRKPTASRAAQPRSNPFLLWVQGPTDRKARHCGRMATFKLPKTKYDGRIGGIAPGERANRATTVLAFG